MEEGARTAQGQAQYHGPATVDFTEVSVHSRGDVHSHAPATASPGVLGDDGLVGMRAEVKLQKRDAKELFKIARNAIKESRARQEGERGGAIAAQRTSDFMLRQAASMLGNRTPNKGSSVIDERHMWLSKRLSQGFGIADLAELQGRLTSKEVLDNVNCFFGALGPRTLFCFCCDGDVGTLRVSFEPEEIGQGGKVMFFVRTKSIAQSVPFNTISDELLVGESSGSVIKTFSRMLQQVYIPLITGESDVWGNCTTEDSRHFFSNLSRFSMTLADVVQTLDSRVQLTKVDQSLLPPPLPSGAASPHSAATGDAGGRASDACSVTSHAWGGDIPQLERVAREWKNAADQFLDNDDPTLESLQDYGPDAPLLYWRERLAHLNALNEQFEAQDTKSVVGALTAAKSAHIKLWRETEARLREATNEANENVKHLTALNKHFEQILTRSPAQIAEDLPMLFSKVKMVRVMSKYLQNSRTMTGLLVKITNQIILECRKYINDGGGIWKQDVKDLLAKFRECVHLNLQCQQQYRATKHERVGGVKELPFSFDESQIFAKFEHFSARLGRLIQIFETILLVQTIAAQSLPGLSQVCTSFWTAVEVLKKRPYDLLDYTVTVFEKDYALMMQMTTQLETELQEVIHQSFSLIESTDQALDLLSKFQALMTCDNLRPYLNTKYLDIFTNFSQDLDGVANMYERLKHDPPLSRDAPPVVGRIGWVRHLLKLIEVPMHKFRQHTSLMISKESKAIIKKYNKIASVFVEYELLWERAWRNLLENSKQGLSATLLVKHPETGKIVVNFDQAVLQLIREARYMRELGMEIPEIAKSVLNRELELKQHVQVLGFMLLEYDEVLRFVLPDLKPIYKPYLAELESLLSPGLTLLTWTSTAVDEFIERFTSSMESIRSFFQKIMDMYEHRINKNLMVISNVSLVAMPDSVVATELFVSEQESIIRAKSIYINEQCMSIGTAVNEILELVRSFPAENTVVRLHSRDIVSVIEKLWELVFQAVFNCIKRSIERLKKRIKSAFGGLAGLFSSVQGTPFFRVNVELVLRTLKTNPSLNDVQLAINRCALAIIRSVRVKPWVLGASPKQVTLKNISDRVLASRGLVPILLLLTGTVEKIKIDVLAYVDTFKRFEFLWSVDREAAMEQFLARDPTMDDFIERLTFYDAAWADIRSLSTDHTIGPLSMNNQNVKASLKEELDAWKQLYTSEIHGQALQMLGQHLEWIRNMARKLDITVRDLDDVRTISSSLKEIIQSEIEQEEATLAVDQRFRVCLEFGHDVPPSEMGMLETMKAEWERLQTKAQQASEKLRKVQDGFKADLHKAVANFKTEAKAFRKDFDINGPMFAFIDPEEGIARMKKFQKIYEAKAKKIATFQQGEELFGLPKTTYAAFDEARGDLAVMSQLYSLYTYCTQAVAGYHKLSLAKLSVTLSSIIAEIEGATKRIEALPERLVHYRAYIKMKELVQSLADVMPLLAVLTNPAMRARHWQEVMVLTQTVLAVNSPSFSLADLMQADLHKHYAAIQDVCEGAQAELACEEQVEQISKLWHDDVLHFANFKNLGLVMLDAALTRSSIESMEDSLVTLHTLLSSRASIPNRDTIRDLITKLSAVQDLLDIWLGVQHIWCYVGIVFSAPDIHKQLPQEAKRFENVDKSYIAMMHDAFGIRFVMAFARHNEHMRVRLAEIKGQLEICQRFLSGYLDAKRNVFPRLYFASDTVLLEALSQNSDINSMSHMMVTLFDNVMSLDADKRRHTYTAMRSHEDEQVHFVSELNSDMGVELLLCTVEREMHHTMHTNLSDAASRGMDYIDTEDIEAFVDDFPSQVCLVGLQIYWSMRVSESMGTGQGKEDRLSLHVIIRRLTTFIDKLSGRLHTPRGRLKALNVLQMLHQLRDVTEGLVHKKVREAGSFEWYRQVRFSWDLTAQECEMRLGGYRQTYGFEYVGQRQRLIATPQTNLQSLFIMQSLHSRSFTALSGPSGGGKTELIKDFGRCLGQFVVLFNCSREVTASSFANIFSGICQSGVWGVLDEPGRVRRQALSVMAQHLQMLMEALRGGKTSMVDGIEMVMSDRAGFFASTTFPLSHPCHPGGGGGASHDFVTRGAGGGIPDNLRGMFRVLSVTAMDIEAVLRIRFAAIQLEDPAKCARLVAAFLAMCRNCFTKRPQYDFGTRDAMAVCRAITSPRAMAARTDLEKPLSAELECVIALKEHYANFLGDEGDESALFPLLMSKVFGDACGHVPAPRVGFRELERGLDQEVLASGINQPQPQIVEQCMRLHEATQAWHGVMLVGPACSCKTLCTSVLLNVVSSASGKAHRAAYINPVSMAPAQLFGYIEPRTKEWQDGAFSAIWRRVMRNEQQVTWIVLDGPIDSTWADNLSTVLDDTRLLILPNGDRTPMAESCRILFEVDSLAGCSPATVSRTGLVSFSDKLSTVQSIINSWLAGRRPEESELVSTYLEKLVFPVFTFLERECKPVVSWNPKAQVLWALRLLEAMLADSVSVEEVPDRLVLERYVIYSIAWVSMGILDQEDRIKLDRRISALTNNVPREKKGVKSRDLLIDHILADSTSGVGNQLWEHANEQCYDSWRYPIQTSTEMASGKLPPIDLLMVPTTASVTLKFLASYLHDSMGPMLIIGEHGCGKSTAVDSILKLASRGGGGIAGGGMNSVRMVMSKGTKAKHLQANIERCVKKRQGRVYGPSNKRQMIFIIHDVNLPEPTKGGDQAPSELLRDLLERDSMYSPRMPGERMDLVDIWYAVMAQSPNQGWPAPPVRLRSHLFNVFIVTPTAAELNSIFSRQITGRFEVGSVSQAMRESFMLCSQATIDLCAQLNAEIMPLRAFHHYSITIHDMARAIRGIIRAVPMDVTSHAACVSLWVHECGREFGDKLVGDARKLYPEVLNKVCMQQFGVDLEATRITASDSIWRKVVAWTDCVPRDFESIALARLEHGNDYQGPNGKDVDFSGAKSYRGAMKMQPVMMVCEKRIEDLNAEAYTVMDRLDNLVLFPEMVMHILAIVRVLGMEGGHMSMNGSAKDGKVEASRLATFMAGGEYVALTEEQVSTKQVLQDELKKALLKTVAGSKQVVFLPIGSNIDSDSLDLIASTLVSASNLDLFEADEWDGLIQGAEFQALLEEEHKLHPQQAWSSEGEVFRRITRRNFHLILSFSTPLGDFSDLVASLPALKGRFTLDIWHPWAQVSLEEFARTNLRALRKDIEDHRTTICNKDIRDEVTARIKESAEKLAQEEEAERDGQDVRPPMLQHRVLVDMEFEAAVKEAIEAENHFRSDLVKAMFLHVPRQMAQAHFAMMRIADDYNHDTHQVVHYPFSLFRYYGETFHELYMKQFQILYDRNLRIKKAVMSLERCEKDIQTLHVGTKGMMSSVKAAADICDSIMTKMTAETTVCEKAKIDLAAVQKQMRTVEAKLNAEAEFSSQYIKDLKTMSAKAKEPLVDLQGHHINGLGEMKSPPDLVARVFDAVLIIIGVKIEKVQIIEVKGRKQIKDSWQIASKMMLEGVGAVSFLAAMRRVNLEEITLEQFELLQPYLSAEDFSVDRVRSLAGGICIPVMKFILLTNMYLARKTEIVPFLTDYFRMQEQHAHLSLNISKMAEKLAESHVKVEQLRKSYDDAVARRQNQESADDRKQANIKSAEGLIAGLKHQQQRWADSYRTYHSDVHKIAGNCSLAAAFLSYCGPLNHDYRMRAVGKALLGTCRDNTLNLKQPVNVLSYLCGDHEMAKWCMQGLAQDEGSMYSALVVTHSNMWPLLVDPHKQGVSWLTNHVKDKLEMDMKVLFVNDEKFHPTLIDCVCFGIPVMVLGVDCDIRMGITHLLQKELIIEGKTKYIMIKDKKCEYNSQFQLYLFTNIISPRYSAEFASNLMIVNFASDDHVLETQLLVAILHEEEHSIYAERFALSELESNVTISIKEEQDCLLEILCTFEGSLLDSTTNLNEVIRIKDALAATSKVKDDIKKRKAAIKESMDEYTVVAKQAARLLRAVGCMRSLDSMYQLSTDRFLKLVRRAFDDVPRSPNIRERISQVTDSLSLSIYTRIAEGLLPQHKPVWLLALALQIEMTKDDITQTEINFIAGGGRKGGSGAPGAPKSGGEIVMKMSDMEGEDSRLLHRWREETHFLNEEGFIALLLLRETIPVFKLCKGCDIFDTIHNHRTEFQAWYASEDPENSPIPGYETTDSATAASLEGGGSAFRPAMRLALIRAVRPDRFLPASRDYARAILGTRFLEPVRVDINSAYRHSDMRMPIVVVAAEPCDALAILQAAADRRGITLRSVPLGEGQKDLAQKLLASSPGLGNWAVLENGHLDPTFVASIPHYMQKLDHADEHFRLFITTPPSASLPPALFAISICQVIEHPRGLKESLYQTFQTLSKQVFEAVREPEWLMLVFGMSFMHSISIARMNYGAAGWSVPYDLRRTDLLSCLGFLEVTLNSFESRTQTGRLAIPWTNIQQVISKSLYGGCLSDEHDVALLDTYTQRYINKGITNPEVELVPGLTMPQITDQFSILRQISDYPEMEKASMYGLNMGLEMRKRSMDSASLVEHFANTVFEADSHKNLAESSRSVTARITELLAEPLKPVPEQLLDLSHATGLPLGFNMDSVKRDARRIKSMLMRTFFVHECTRLNEIITDARTKLQKIKDLLMQGVRLTGQLRRDADDIERGLVPQGWEEASWRASSLADWAQGATYRRYQLAKWQELSWLSTIWLGGLLRPTAFAWMYALHVAEMQGMEPHTLVPSLEPPPPLVKEVAGYSKENSHRFSHFNASFSHAQKERQDSYARQNSDSDDADSMGLRHAQGEFELTVVGLWMEGAAWDNLRGKVVHEHLGGWKVGSLTEAPSMKLIATAPQAVEQDVFLVPCYSTTRRGADNLVMTVRIRTDEPPQVLVMGGFAIFLANDDPSSPLSVLSQSQESHIAKVRV